MLIDSDEVQNFITESFLKAKKFTNYVHIHLEPENALDCLWNVSRLRHSHCIIPEYIFMEINFPLSDGFYFLEQYQRLPAEMKAIKIIILSASITKADIERAKKFRQVVAYLHKPLTDKDLMLITNY